MSFFGSLARRFQRVSAGKQSGGRVPRRKKSKRPAKAVTHELCGLRDYSAAGWFNSSKGELVKGFPLGPGDTYLDVGCGTGGMAMFAARLGCSVIATDINKSLVESLQRNLEVERLTNCRCLVSDSNPLPLGDGIATRINCSEVLEHVRDPIQLLAELVRVGAPGSLYLLSVPDPSSEEAYKGIADPSYWQEPNHVRIFGREQFADAVTGAGLEIISRYYFGFYHSVWWMLNWSPIQEGKQPMLDAWSRTWSKVLDHHDGLRIQQALDRVMPKSQVILARKPI